MGATLRNIRTLPVKDREKVRGYFKTMTSVAHDYDLSSIPGEMFAAYDGGRVIGGAWVRPYPGRLRIGDVHIVASRYRFRDYGTIVAFDLFLRERAQAMALSKWRAIIPVDSAHVISALEYLQFQRVSTQAFPGMGETVILEREVM